MSEDGSHGQHELIVDDVRAISDAVAAITQAAPGGAGEQAPRRRRQHWVGGWIEVYSVNV